VNVETPIVVALAVCVVALALVAMLAAHEKHYKERRYRLLEARLGAVESILTEDRRT
jgi:hypothetical protein